MNATIIVAVVGLITTGAAPLLQIWLKSRADTRAWKRDFPTRAYVEALTYVQIAEATAERHDDVYAQRETISKPDQDLITAQLRLIA